MSDRELFLAALDLSPVDRGRFLAEQCADDTARLVRVAKLLVAHEEAGSFLEQPIDAGPTLDAPPVNSANAEGETATGNPDGASTASHEPGAAEGALIAGRYKLREQIGEGGMGTVWLADQTEPVKRRVAVKLVRADRGQSKTILPRFEAERQAIALMDHPHIAKLLDAGTAETGQPFFVMELVKGVPVTEYCDTHRLSVPERLALFTQICEAVQHAHQKGIIHRDLKPSNILVESHDGKPVPKVIDFGLAKATSGMQLTEHTLHTVFGNVMGTPLYMAPEQATFNALDVDTRADVYALGVVLYELLTGTTPIEKARLKNAALEEMLRIIREEDAPTPSSRIYTNMGAPTAAAVRQTEPVRLGRFVKGDLDWIVMKALAKDRDQRYATANGFARDVERFLSHEPVLASPPSVGYKVRKFVRRNRPQVIAAGLVLLALVAGIIGTTLGLIEARRQTDIALREADAKEKARAEEARQRALAEAKQKEAETNLGFSRKGNAILGSVFAGLDPKQIADSGRPLQDVLRENLTTAVRELEGSAIGDPLAVAAMQVTLARSLVGLGEAHLAVQVLQRALDTRKAHLGPNHPDTLACMHSLAWAYDKGEQHTKALPLFQETLEKMTVHLGPDHPDTLACMYSLGLAYYSVGQMTTAVTTYLVTLEKMKTHLGTDHPDTLSCMHSLALAYEADAKGHLGVPIAEEALTRRKANLRADHPDTLTSMQSLAYLYANNGRLTLALPLAEEALRLRKARLGADHPDTISCMGLLAGIHQRAGRVARALPLYEEALTLATTRLGADDARTFECMTNLAWGYQAACLHDKAVPLLEEALRLRKAKIGANHPHTLGTMENLSRSYYLLGQYAKSVPLLEEMVETRKATRGPDHPHTLDGLFSLANAYVATKQGEKAAATYNAYLDGIQKQVPKDSPQYTNLLAQFAHTLLAYDQHAAAEQMLRECLAIREKVQPDAWTTFNTQSMLGGALLLQGKHADAEPLLLKGYEGMMARETLMPRSGAGVFRIPEALDRLIDLYLATGKPDEVKKWRAERAKYPFVAPMPRPVK